MAAGPGGLPHAPDKHGTIRPGYTGTKGWCLLESQHCSRHTQQPRLRWPLLLTPRDSNNPCPAAQGGLLQIVGPTTPLQRLALAGGFPCYVSSRHLGRVEDCAMAAGREQNRLRPQRQAHLLASGNVVLLRRRQAAGRPLQQGHLPLRMPRQAGEIGVPKCGCPNLLGPELEGRVWTEVANFLGNPDIFQAEMDRRVHGQEGQGAEAEREIAKLNRRLADVDHRETELVALRLRGAVSEVALDRNAALLRVERTHLTEELERQRETMSTLEQGQAAVASLKALREHMRDRLDSATQQDRRTVLEALETRVTVGVGGLLEVLIGIP